MVKIKKRFVILLVFVMMFSVLSACGKKETETGNQTATPPVTEQKETDEKVEATPTPEPPRDLGGIEVLVADWWSTDEQTPPATQREEDTLAYREEIQSKHNFTLKQINIGTWAEYQEIFITSTMAGDPVADIFIMDQKFVPEPLKQGLFYPVSKLPSFDFNDKIWNKTITDYLTQGGEVYGFSEDQNGPGLGVFWNKRLFEEAGLDPDLLYDLQASGEWTWNKLEELANVLTRDTNADGITDVYAITAWQVEIPKAAVFSNGSDYVRYNEETGRYENNQMSSEFLDAVTLAVDFYNKGYIMPDPEGAEFTWFEGAFVNGKGAMCITEWYRHTAFQKMEDDWGYVFFPAGPKGKMQTMYTGNVRVMPIGLDPKRADDVAFAYSLWVSPTPGYDTDELDLSNYYNVVRDSRAVEETIKPMILGQGVRSLLYQVPGLSYRYGSNMDGGGLGALSAVEIAEAASAKFDAIIDDFYAK